MWMYGGNQSRSANENPTIFDYFNEAHRFPRIDP